jgi:hypothetical protein
MIAADVAWRGVRWSPVAALAGVLFTGCGGSGPSGDGDGVPPHGDSTNSGSVFTPNDQGPNPWPQVGCDPTLSVKSDGPALIVRDPAVLSSFTLERVLTQLISLSGSQGPSPEELLQRLFDTENTAASGVFPYNTHCDSPGNGAFKNGAAIGCPRAEGELAKSAGLFVPDDPDYFAPIALVNRFDLAPFKGDTCGEYRLVFAKWSGRSDPNDRLFLIFEGALKIPFGGDVLGCHPVAETWAALEKETDPAKIAARLEAFYFTGLPGFSPLVHPAHFGLLSDDGDSYGHSRGQVRVSQRMEAPWEMREFHLLTAAPGDSGPSIFFAPVTVKNSPLPALFNPATQTQTALIFRSMFANTDGSNLAAPDLAHIRMQTHNSFNAGESAVGGLAGADYAAQVESGDSAKFMEEIMHYVNSPKVPDCPPGEALTATDILNRATTQTCAGCHAPQNFLGPERKIGCGLTWPSALGEAHIDEHGSLSPALTDVFLPHRASVMTTFLQLCDMEAIYDNLQPGSGGVMPE